MLSNYCNRRKRYPSLKVAMRHLRGKPRRTGIIPYTVVDNVIYCLLGVDRQSSDYSDFGGGRKRNESFAMGAVRECREETENILSFKPDMIENYLSIWNEKIGIVFVPVMLTDMQIKSIAELINKKLAQKDNAEMASVEWISWGVFIDIIKHQSYKQHKLYEEIRSLLYDDFYHPNRLKHILVNKYNSCPLIVTDCISE